MGGVSIIYIYIYMILQVYKANPSADPAPAALVDQRRQARVSRAMPSFEAEACPGRPCGASTWEFAGHDLPLKEDKFTRTNHTHIFMYIYIYVP